MRQQLQQRLYSLKTEFEAGQKLLAEYEEKQRNLRETLLRARKCKTGRDWERAEGGLLFDRLNWTAAAWSVTP